MKTKTSLTKNNGSERSDPKIDVSSLQTEIDNEKDNQVNNEDDQK